MARKAASQREVADILTVTFVNEIVIASLAQSKIPSGFRWATDKECSLMADRDPAFLYDLRFEGPAWAMSADGSSVVLVNVDSFRGKDGTLTITNVIWSDKGARVAIVPDESQADNLVGLPGTVSVDSDRINALKDALQGLGSYHKTPTSEQFMALVRAAEGVIKGTST